MLRKGLTRLEAARMWVSGFNAIPTQMILKLMTADPDDWCEVTCPAVGDRYMFLMSVQGKLSKSTRRHSVKLRWIAARFGEET